MVRLQRLAWRHSGEPPRIPGRRWRHARAGENPGAAVVGRGTERGSGRRGRRQRLVLGLTLGRWRRSRQHHQLGSLVELLALHAPVLEPHLDLQWRTDVKRYQPTVPLLLNRVAMQQHKMRTVATRVECGLSVCLCWSLVWALQKRLNRSRGRLWCGLVGPRNHVVGGAHISHGKGHMLTCSDMPAVKGQQRCGLWLPVL